MIFCNRSEVRMLQTIGIISLILAVWFFLPFIIYTLFKVAGVDLEKPARREVVTPEALSAYLAGRVREIENNAEREKIKELGVSEKDIKYMGVLKNG